MKYNRHALKRLRTARNWNQNQLATKAGIERQTVAYLERGVTVPNARTLAKLASALDVSVSEFFTNGALHS